MKPNVIIIITDDQGYPNLGCHGNPYVKTPVLDRFSQESTRFDYFQVSPVCSPTRAAMLTGQYEFRSGISHVYKGRSQLRNGSNVTISELLSGEGYRTGLFGKWHLGHNYPARPEDRGFDETLCFRGAAIGQSPDYWENGYFDPMLLHNGSYEKHKGFCTDIFFSAAIEWIEANRDEPFFAYIPTNAPHAPLIAPEEYARPYLEQGLPSGLANYYGMITNIDDNVDALLQALVRLDLEKETLVIFMSDNGPYFEEVYNAGMRGQKTRTWEGGTRVPCFFRWPGTIAPRTRKLAGAIDILPTIAELCGAHLPADYPTDGMSLAPLLLGDPGDWPDRYLFANLAFWHADQGADRSKYMRASVRSEKYRFVSEADLLDPFVTMLPLDESQFDPDNWELHDMENDLGERRDIKEEQPEVAQAMRNAYEAWWDEMRVEMERYVRIQVGTPFEPRTMLSCFDWFPSADFPGRVVENLSTQAPIAAVASWVTQASSDPEQALEPSTVLQGPLMGSWLIEVMTAGRYRATLRLLPDEATQEVALRPGHAHATFGETPVMTVLSHGDSGATLEADLQPGPLELTAWFSGQLPDERPLGAFFVYLELVSDVTVSGN